MTNLKISDPRVEDRAEEHNSSGLSIYIYLPQHWNKDCANTMKSESLRKCCLWSWGYNICCQSLASSNERYIKFVGWSSGNIVGIYWHT